ncbi:MAG: hypothetical protein R3F34_01790 [Planctomycetota bacterium]
MLPSTTVRGALLAASILAASATALAQTPICTDWRPHGAAFDGGIRALVAYDDGSGSILVAGGAFVSAGGAPASHVARFDGTSWSPLGVGLSGGPGIATNSVFALASADLGDGPRLFAGGWFTNSGTATVHSVAQWDGATWSALGSGVTHAFSTSPVVIELLPVDLGSGTVLVASGLFDTIDGVAAASVASYDGTTWTPLATSMTGGFPAGGAAALVSFDDGSGPALYAGGDFQSVDGVAAIDIARFDGTTWSALPGLGTGIVEFVTDLVVFDDGTGPALYAGGLISLAGAPGVNVVRWDGSTWTPVGAGLDGRVDRLLVHDDGSGPQLYACGTITGSGGTPLADVARFDGTAWQPVDARIHGTFSIFDEHAVAIASFVWNGAPALAVGGNFTASASGEPALALFGTGPCPPFVRMVGCAGPTARLDPPATPASIGTTLTATVLGESVTNGFAATYFGLRGGDLAGCGTVFDGVGGDVLLADVVAPVMIDLAFLVGGNANVSIDVPANPALVGLRVALQTFLGDPTTGVAELSDGLLVTLYP